MKKPILVLIIVLVSGCSGEKKDSSNVEPKSKIQRSENQMSIAELCERRTSDDTYVDLVGQKVSIVGTFEYCFYQDEDGFVVQVSNQSTEGFAAVNCLFESSDVLNDCMLGQDVSIEGTILSDDEFNVPILTGCRLLGSSGNTVVSTLTAADFVSGKRYPKTGRFGILTGIVENVVPNRPDSEVLVNLKAKEKICIHFSANRNPDIEKVLKLEKGDEIRAFGSKIHTRSLSVFGSKIAISKCVLLRPTQ